MHGGRNRTAGTRRGLGGLGVLVLGAVVAIDIGVLLELHARRRRHRLSERDRAFAPASVRG